MKIKKVDGKVIISLKIISFVWERDCIELTEEDYKNIEEQGIAPIANLIKKTLLKEIEETYYWFIKSHAVSWNIMSSCTISPITQMFEIKQI